MEPGLVTLAKIVGTLLFGMGVVPIIFLLAPGDKTEPPEEEPRAWSEMQAVLHLTLLARSGARVSVLRGGASIEDIDIREIATIATALANAHSRRRAERRVSVALSPAVSATVAAGLQ